MADAASALVVTRANELQTCLARVHTVQLHCDGRCVDVLASTSAQPSISISAATFEQQVAPVHFVLLNRVLSRALDCCRLSRNDISALVYPNTTLLDRQSAIRALDFGSCSLVGPGPTHLGHAFSNDLIINSRELLEAKTTHSRYSAWLAAGSGFTWGAAIVESQ
jgi:3-oxoacyl-[acyl-carrier-protein] synthase III